GAEPLRAALTLAIHMPGCRSWPPDPPCCPVSGKWILAFVTLRALHPDARSSTEGWLRSRRCAADSLCFPVRCRWSLGDAAAPVRDPDVRTLGRGLHVFRATSVLLPASPPLPEVSAGSDSFGPVQ